MPKKSLHAKKLARARRRREAELNAYQANGLVKPDLNAPEPGTKAFNDLRKQWYAKLAQSEANKPAQERFKDIEWAEDPNSRHIRLPASRGRKLTPGKQLYYAMGRNFATHGKFKTLMESTAWNMHIEGQSYRKILAHLGRKHRLRKSLYWLFYYIEDLAKRCKQFNTEHAEGLLNPANQDSFASDVLIGDFRLQTADNKDNEYGIPVDAGFWESVPKPK